MNSFNLKIVSLDGQFFEGEAKQIALRTIDGQVAIQAGHMPYVTAIGAGECRLYVDQMDQPKRGACIGGLLSVSKDIVLLAATTFEWAENIDVERAQRAKERSEKIIESNVDAHSTDIAKIKLTRANVRLRVAENAKL